ncbi:uncharacterized protein LOC111030737 isoform X2 [Myzus persicae]|uniref:uncharacterized protein LOC111030737 isoform X2 n=1 Tax=Myzus persicae TaxID=13164 RepID=UPI000B938BCF|nr:uncharacterized protein LOC111030737 isoform X2 [Myzus persicae]
MQRTYLKSSNTDSIETTFLVPNITEVPHIENLQDTTDVNEPSKYYLTLNRPSPYTSSNPSPSTSTPTHQKYGKYKPMEWTIETILELLHTSNDGRFVLADSKANNGSLSDDGQNTLTKLLINFLFQDNSKGSDLFFRKIATLICKVFPNEQKSVYFIPAGEGNTHAKGKLIERWKNVSRRLRSIGAIESDKKKPSSTTVDLASHIFPENVETAKIWLSENGLSANFEDIKSNWIITYQIRKLEIQGVDNKSITDRHLSDIFKAWPILCSSRGHDLISEDFKLEYPQIEHETLSDWSVYIKKWILFSDIIVSVRRSSVKDNHARELLKHLDAAQLRGSIKTVNVLKLLLIPYLVPTKTQIKKTQKKSWKPSLSESAAAFAVHVTNLTELEAELGRRRLKYVQYGTTIQPFIVLVGQDIFSVESAYVRVDDNCWNFDCPLKALNACFTTYNALHCTYPRVCYESWLILQLQLYNFTTIYDQKSSIITSLSSKMNALKNTYL